MARAKLIRVLSRSRLSCLKESFAAGLVAINAALIGGRFLNAYTKGKCFLYKVIYFILNKQN